MYQRKRIVNNIANQLPDGPWKTPKGTLDKAFHEWVAKQWQTRFNLTDFYMAKGDTLAYFCNNPERLKIRWAQYQDEFRDRFDKAQQRVRAGVTIAEDEKKLLRDNYKAVIGEELNPFAEFDSDEIKQLTAATAEPPPLLLSGESDKPVGAIAPAETINPMAGLAEVLKKMAMPSAPTAKPKTTLEEINELLGDRILRPEYQSRAKREFEGFDFIQDADGLICEVIDDRANC